jgi:hypothetical protein
MEQADACTIKIFFIEEKGNNLAARYPVAPATIMVWLLLFFVSMISD